MTSIALLLAATVTSYPQASSSSLANGFVWKMLRNGTAEGGSIVCSPTGELAGIASLTAAGIKVPEGVAAMAGGDASSASRLVGSLYATDKAFSASSTMASSETSIWVTGATTKDGALANFDNLTPFYVNQSDRRTGVEKWLAQRVPSRVQTTSPEVSRIVVTAATYGAQFLPCGQERFSGTKIPYVMSHFTRYSEDDNIQIGSAPLPENKKFSLVIASPVGATSMSETVDSLEKNWREAVSGLPAYQLTVQFPRISQTVDRSIDRQLELKPEDGISVRERLTVSLGMMPLAAKPSDRSKANANRDPVWMNSNYLSLPAMGFGGTNQGSQKRKIWIVDRPFFYAIVDNSSGQIVYAGTYLSPNPG